MSDKKQQTAVQWFFMTMNIRGLLPNDEIVECYNQAKEMEKQYITDSYIEGCRKGFNEFGENAELYFTKTFTNELP